MYLFVGLGNVGKEYEFTRHNFGFLTLDQIIKDYNFTLQSNKFKSELFSGFIGENKIIAIKPQTFMNRSGAAVGQVASFFKVPSSNIIVFHDEVDIDFGKIKAKIGGGNAGHNGLKSIDEAIGKNYSRIRLGVGKGKFELSDHVLSKFSRDELYEVEKISEKISKLIPDLLENNIESFLNKFYL